MRTLGLFAVALLSGCPDEERTAALETKVKELDEALDATKQELAEQIADSKKRRDDDDLERKLEQLQAKLDKIESMGRSGFTPPSPRPPRPEPDRSKTYSVAVEGFPSIGPADAKVTIVKAYDHACPYCERSRQTMDDLRSKYGNDVRVVYKPLVVHPTNAMAGALAACAAHRQGKFKLMNDAIWDKGYKNSRQLDQSTTPSGEKCWDTQDGCALVVGYARDLQLDGAKLKRDMKACQASVTASQRDYQALAISATPAFFINGRYISGAVPLDTFVPIIDEELRKANERIAAGTKKNRYYDEWVVQKGLRSLDPAQPVGGILGP